MLHPVIVNIFQGQSTQSYKHTHNWSIPKCYMVTRWMTKVQMMMGITTGWGVWLKEIRCWGCVPDTELKQTVDILHWMQCLTGSQCRAWTITPTQVYQNNSCPKLVVFFCRKVNTEFWMSITIKFWAKCIHTNQYNLFLNCCSRYYWQSQSFL